MQSGASVYESGYVGVNIAKTWSDANAYCTATYGTYLATVTSLEENNAVRAAATEAGISTDDYVWIGYNDIDNESNWVWADGSDNNFTLWESGEPNDGTIKPEDDCALLWASRNDTWADGNCLGSLAFVCGVIPTAMPSQTPS